MTQLTIRKLDPLTIDRLKERAAAAGHSMEEEARQILKETVRDEQLARQRAWVEKMRSLRRELFGDRILPDSSNLFREMRDERTHQIEEWAVPKKRNE